MNLNRILIVIFIIALALQISASIALAAEAEPVDARPGGDIDPTRPVFFNIREEFFNLRGNDWRNAFILRTDIVKIGGLRNFLLRFDVPISSADIGRDTPQGRGAVHGLGDIYGQILLVPYRAEHFFFAVGSGLTTPSATDDNLGGGKWQAAPLAIPGWWFKDRRALFFIKVQNFVSFAGQHDRADVHYMTVNPFLAVKLSERWWAGADMEAKVNWERDNQRSYKSGFFILKMWTQTFGTWIKPEIPWGLNREGDWTVKTSCFWNY